MTLLVSALFDREIAVAMDTYAAGGDGTHYTKCWAPESGQFIVAGTGLFDVVGPWLAEVERMPASSTAADVVEMTPAYLAARRATLIAEHPDAARFHTTGFVYSFDADRRSPVRESFSSRDQFDANHYVKMGFGIFPEVTFPAAWKITGLANTDTDLMKIARHVAGECDRDTTAQVHIDGDLRVIRITPGGLDAVGTVGRIRAGLTATAEPQRLTVRPA